MTSESGNPDFYPQNDTRSCCSLDHPLYRYPLSVRDSDRLLVKTSIRRKLMMIEGEIGMVQSDQRMHTTSLGAKDQCIPNLLSKVPIAILPSGKMDIGAIGYKLNTLPRIPSITWDWSKVLDVAI